jgi:hypothetical protein
MKITPGFLVIESKKEKEVISKRSQKVEVLHTFSGCLENGRTLLAL